jgi:hypothetical protein
MWSQNHRFDIDPFLKAVDHPEKPWFPVLEGMTVLVGPRSTDGVPTGEVSIIFLSVMLSY